MFRVELSAFGHQRDAGGAQDFRLCQPLCSLMTLLYLAAFMCSGPRIKAALQQKVLLCLLCFHTQLFLLGQTCKDVSAQKERAAGQSRASLSKDVFRRTDIRGHDEAKTFNM